jgi:uncharacterized protein
MTRLPSSAAAIHPLSTTRSGASSLKRCRSVLMGSAGSEAVRSVIETYQPLVALHGHIHESRGVAKLAKTVCLNPGREYIEGVLHGALLEFDEKRA